MKFLELEVQFVINFFLVHFKARVQLAQCNTTENDYLLYYEHWYSKSTG